MKALIAALLLTATLIASAQQPPAIPCLTNVAVTAMGSTWFTVSSDSSSGCFNTIQSYTNLLCPDLQAPNGNVGTSINFYFPCTSSSTAIATVTFMCNQGVLCGINEGGGSYCASGGSFTITVPPQRNTISVRIFSAAGCCSLTYQEVNQPPLFCLPQGGGDQ